MDTSPLISHPKMGSAGKTGSWRTQKPVVKHDLCSRCLNCYFYCPEGVISENIEVDYEYCKGCGVCSRVCEQRAIVMVPENS